MITWPILLALILAFFSVRYTINMEEEEEKEREMNEKNEENSCE
jgi:hypothetical protein